VKAVEDAFAAYFDRQPNDKERQRLMRGRAAAGIKDNDALWTLLMVLEHYETLYERFPALIAKAAADVTDNARAAAEGELKAAAARTQGRASQVRRPDGARHRVPRRQCKSLEVDLDHLRARRRDLRWRWDRDVSPGCQVGHRGWATRRLRVCARRKGSGDVGQHARGPDCIRSCQGGQSERVGRVLRQGVEAAWNQLPSKMRSGRDRWVEPSG
jgi:hypothetical protein